MSAVIAVPELMAQAATDLATIGDTLSAAHLTAAVPTVAVLPAAADEVSTGIAHLFSGYGQEYQKLAGEVAASYEQFAQHLTASAGAYAGAEDAIAAFLQDFPIGANFLSASPTGWFTFLETTQPSLLFYFLILFLFAIIIPLLLAISIPLLGVVLPLVIAVGLPLSIAAVALIFGPPILIVLLAQLSSAL
jgi:hypothetical protein